MLSLPSLLFGDPSPCLPCSLSVPMRSVQATLIMIEILGATRGKDNSPPPQHLNLSKFNYAQKWHPKVYTSPNTSKCLDAWCNWLMNAWMQVHKHCHWVDGAEAGAWVSKDN